MKTLILWIPFYWYLEDEWGYGFEFGYIREPRRFYKNKLYKDYTITEVFIDEAKVKSKRNLVFEFYKSLWKKELIMDETYLTFSQ